MRFSLEVSGVTLTVSVWIQSAFLMSWVQVALSFFCIEDSSVSLWVWIFPSDPSWFTGDPLSSFSSQVVNYQCTVLNIEQDAMFLLTILPYSQKSLDSLYHPLLFSSFSLPLLVLFTFPNISFPFSYYPFISLTFLYFGFLTEKNLSKFKLACLTYFRYIVVFHFSTNDSVLPFMVEYSPLCINATFALFNYLLTNMQVTKFS